MPPKKKKLAPAAVEALTQMVDLAEKIRERAYELWMQEGMPDGRAEEHWLQAEQEVVALQNQPQA